MSVPFKLVYIRTELFDDLMQNEFRNPIKYDNSIHFNSILFAKYKRLIHCKMKIYVFHTTQGKQSLSSWAVILKFKRLYEKRYKITS